MLGWVGVHDTKGLPGYGKGRGVQAASLDGRWRGLDSRFAVPLSRLALGVLPLAPFL